MLLSLIEFNDISCIFMYIVSTILDVEGQKSCDSDIRPLSRTVSQLIATSKKDLSPQVGHGGTGGTGDISLSARAARHKNLGTLWCCWRSSLTQFVNLKCLKSQSISYQSAINQLSISYQSAINQLSISLAFSDHFRSISKKSYKSFRHSDTPVEAS